MENRFENRPFDKNLTVLIVIIAMFGGWLLSGCTVAQQIGLLPTPTSTTDVPATQTAQAAKQTADAQTSATAQAQATSTAQAEASATAQAQATARALVTATARAEATAAAAATKTALVAYIEALAQKAGRA